MSRAIGMSPNTIRRGLAELVQRQAHPDAPVEAWIRRAGGGRKPLTTIDPGPAGGPGGLVDPLTRGDPESPLRWTCKSTRNWPRHSTAQGQPVSATHGGPAPARPGLQPAEQPQDPGRGGAPGPQRPVRAHQRDRCRRFNAAGQPVISVDTKKKELVGDFKNGGREWRPDGRARARSGSTTSRTSELGKAIPYGVYDLTRNEGWVSVGIDHDTAEFAVEAIRRWWTQDGARALSGSADELLITADGGRQQRLSRRGCGRWRCRTGRRAGPADPRLPLPAGHEQVEQDRAPDVLPHHAELAWRAARQPRGHRQPDRQHRNRRRDCGSVRASTAASTRQASRSRPRSSLRSTSDAPTSTATGTTRSCPIERNISQFIVTRVLASHGPTAASTPPTTSSRRSVSGASSPASPSLRNRRPTALPSASTEP